MKKTTIYCDICNNEIPDGAVIYPLKISGKNVNIGRLNDICFNCGNKIAMLILSLQPPYKHYNEIDNINVLNKQLPNSFPPK